MAVPDLSRRQARQELLDWPEVGARLGHYGNATVAAQSLTDAVKFGGHYSGNYFMNQGQLVLPGNALVDRFRDPGALTTGGTGVLALKGNAVSATGQGAGVYYEFWRRGISWDRINEAFFAACLETYYMQRSAVGGIFDADFLEPDYDGWIASHTDVTIQFDPSAENNDSGYYAMLLTYGGSLDTRYVSRAAHVHMEAGERFYLGGLCKVVSGGPVYWDVYNETTPATLRTRATVTRTGEWFHVGGVYAAQSAGNYNLRLGAAHGTQVAWDCFPNHYTNGLSWDAPSYVNQRYKLDRIDLYDYNRQVSQDVQMARSKQYTSWTRRVDFDLEVLAAESNPNRVQVLPPHRSLPDRDLFYRVKRLVADVYNPDETTPLPGDDNVRAQVMAGFKVRVLGMVEEQDRLGANGLWQRSARQLQADEDAHREVEEEQVAPAHEPRRSRLQV